MLSEGRSGLITAGSGSVNPLRTDKTGALAMVTAHPLYSEACSFGKVFVASIPVAGVAPGTALSTTPPIALLNPLNSGKELAIIATAVGYVSGTLGAGSIVYAYVTPQATIPTGGTELTPVCTKLGQIKGAGRAFSGSTLAATPLILEPVYTMGAFLASTAFPPTITQDLVDGSYIVSPATCFVIQGVSAAGSTPLLIMSIIWEEIDVV